MVSAASLVDGIVALLGEDSLAWIDQLRFVLSPQIHRNLVREIDSVKWPSCQIEIREDTPIRSMLRFPTWSPDLRYVLFGPAYVRSARGINVSGFADGTLVRSWKKSQSVDVGSMDASQLLSLPRRFVKKRLLASFDAFVVQTEGMAQSLNQAFPYRPIEVIPNLLSPAFVYPHLRRWVNLPPRSTREIRLFYPAKGWPHKNHRVLPGVSQAFFELYQRRLVFVTTLTADDHKRLFPRSEIGVINVGPVDAAELPDLFQQTDGLFMPSLNETFSSTPLEASYLRKPVIVSDLPFFREVLGERAVYWDMQSPESAAKLIFSQILGDPAGEPDRLTRIDAAHEWAKDFADSVSIARRHMGFLRAVSKSD